jgi:hypothetical protein
MPQASPSDSPQSDYPELSLPEGGWKSNIPEHLLKDAKPADRWLMEEMSKNTQATDFSCRAAVEGNGLIRKTNGRLKGAEAQIVDLRTEVAQLKVDNLVLKAQVLALAPIVSTVSTAKTLLSSKIVLVVLGMAVLFALGLNRDWLISMWSKLH